MNAEIIAIGSELLTPQRIDTNSLFLTAELNQLGVEVVQKSIVGDDRARLSDAIRAALSRSEVLLLSGGLGPTEDDVTRDAVATALGRGQKFVEEIADGIERRFAHRGRKMPEINKRQANVIEGAEVLANPNGTAPGQWLEESGRYVVLMPGPPPELKPMFANEVLPRLERVLPKQAIRTRFFRVALMPESEVDALIAPVYTKYANPVTTILAAAADIQIHLRARCATAEEAEALVSEVAAKIEPLLGDRIYSRNGDPLEVVVGTLLHEAGAHLAVAESCTGGMLAERITSVPGSSEYFAGGFLTYTNEVKAALLGIDRGLIETEGAVSQAVALEMAKAASERTGAEFGVSVTGVAGPSGGTAETPVGTVWIGVAGPTGARAHRFRFIGDRARIRTLAAQTAIELLRRRLLS